MKQLDMTQEQADRLLKQYAINVFNGNDDIRAGFWNGLTADERTYMTSFIEHMAEAWLAGHLANIHALAIQNEGRAALAKLSLIFAFKAEPAPEPQPPTEERH